jgi:hypothetical protein
MNEEVPRLINVEEAFNEFTRESGGELVSDLVGNNPNFDNADYIFRKELVVAELKCLEKDFPKDIEYQKKIDRLYDKWINQGLVQPFARRTINIRELPERCRDDVIKIFKNPIERIVKKANRQIRETKEYLSLPDAKGVLLLANDGNYSLETEAVLFLVTKIIRVQFTSINYVAYFTVNMKARVPGLNRDVYVWAMAHGEKEKEFSYDFLNALGDGWIEFLGRKVGQNYSNLTVDKEIIEHIKFVR